jgi:molybdopterin molybdotransferase
MIVQSVNKKTEIVSVSDALRRVLAKEIYAQEMVPPFDRSPFDGYAFRGEDTAGKNANVRGHSWHVSYGLSC